MRLSTCECKYMHVYIVYECAFVCHTHAHTMYNNGGLKVGCMHVLAF